MAKVRVLRDDGPGYYIQVKYRFPWWRTYQYESGEIAFFSSEEQAKKVALHIKQRLENKNVVAEY